MKHQTIYLLLLLFFISCNGQDKKTKIKSDNVVIEDIITDVKTHQVVMISEDHDKPKHRVFSETLLQPLYDLGFRYLAIETLSERDSELNSRKFPLQKSGTYSKEPNYANFIRTALEMGYTLIDYEIRMDEEKQLGETNFITFREESQARHLAELIEQKPKAKIFVHAGWNHIKEKTETKWLAERFKEKTGIDPLTISQPHMEENPSLKTIKVHKDLYDKFSIDIMLEYPQDKDIINKFYRELNRVKVTFKNTISQNSKIYVESEYKNFKEQAIPFAITDNTNYVHLMPNKNYLLIENEGQKLFKIEDSDIEIELK